ncbi:SM-20-related protein [Pedobacter sp. AK017]|uniref:2OG-Fe(II) oxygenase n=1 Tax=Pedobacter sp. AK017 TaxID=2723073 RepID=UPI001616BD4B|nr:2OG-Fe(II) oxygenase [Pedobacter sp. AK017]MBB5437581.1 SM-20-related protein [Pedobacter sp. AK017]
MEKIFNQLINSFIKDKVGIAENFISPALSIQLVNNLLHLQDKDQLLLAGTGNKVIVAYNETLRSDKIHWLDRLHNDPYENDFLDLMDTFVAYLNSTCYTGITGYEFHYTLYEKGAFYKKHIDQFRNNNLRQYSMIMYLNEYWTENDGGELCIHHLNHVQHITPSAGKSVFFKSSELAHEVLLTHKPRMSITGWLKTG